jgi:hypothetical protein
MSASRVCCVVSQSVQVVLSESWVQVVCVAPLIVEEASMTESSNGSQSWLSAFCGSSATSGEEACSDVCWPGL